MTMMTPRSARVRSLSSGAKAGALFLLLPITGCTTVLLVKGSTLQHRNVPYTKCVFVVDQQRRELATQAADLCKAVLKEDTHR